MEHAGKYEKSYFLPPVCTYDWVKKDAVTEPPIWCSVDLRDGNQALIEPMSLEEKANDINRRKQKNNSMNEIYYGGKQSWQS